MDFGDILDEWEKRKREAARAARSARAGGLVPGTASEGPPDPAEAARRLAFEAWLDEHEPEDKDAGPAADQAALRAEREARDRRFAAMAPQASIDLHGMGAAEAKAALLAFFERSGRQGLEKVLVVHGKGNHSKEGPVLVRVARKAVEESPWAGRSGPAGREDGGSGALWVAVRKRAESGK